MNNKNTTVVICGSCGAELDESAQTAPFRRSACRKCGSKSRLFKVCLTGTVLVKSELGAKAFRPGHRKAFLEQKVGDSFFRKTQRWVKRVMRIERHNNRYLEHVVDPHTGDTIHFCDEPLTEHRNHGSAKKRLTTRLSGP